MSKVTGWPKHKRFISIEIADNCLSTLCKVANGSFQEIIRQHVMYVWKATLSNFSPRLLAVWKLLIKLGKLSPIGASWPFISMMPLKVYFRRKQHFWFSSCCSFVGLFLLNLLIRRDARLTSPGTAVSCWFLCKWRPSSVLAGFLGDFRLPETVT